MIDTIALILSIIGTPMIAWEKSKVRFAGFSIWFIANVFWLYHWWVLGENAAFFLFCWYQLWCVFGIFGSWNAIRKDRLSVTMIVSPPGYMKSEMMKEDGNGNLNETKSLK